jgi:hypothetical protein
MPKTATIDMTQRIFASLTDTNSCLWFPQLTEDLVETRLRKLEKVIGITASNYGTERVILKDANASRDIIISLPIYNDSETPKVNIQIEELSRNTIEQYESSGVNFYKKEEIISSEVLNCLSDAFQIIRKVPSLFTTVVTLAKSLHIIKPESDEYDVSFSEPHIPFSIFVSAPQTNSEINALRVAEAIIHEAMHLQLTFIERHISLVISGEEMFFSPWKMEYRSPNGILHALFVFCVIDRFLMLLLNQEFSFEQVSHINNRQIAIANEINQIQTFGNYSGLTSIGRTFVKCLIAKA